MLLPAARVARSIYIRICYGTVSGTDPRGPGGHGKMGLLLVGCTIGSYANSYGDQLDIDSLVFNQVGWQTLYGVLIGRLSGPVYGDFC